MFACPFFRPVVEEFAFESINRWDMWKTIRWLLRLRWVLVVSICTPGKDAIATQGCRRPSCYRSLLFLLQGYDYFSGQRL
ncbi:hypothetical protein RRG08_037921 [Elysia crispata]|uniref:Uncharacterized protein n=1 Tax=Elysia crispata TaxID=231223 RepID=A0AAE0XVV6_9GAST|nr:hypothetical protein RRG08_037921 [Elysia crispata]